MFLIQLVDLYYSIRNFICSTSSFQYIQFLISYFYYRKSFEPVGDYSSMSYFTSDFYIPTTDTYKNLILTCKLGGYYICKQIQVPLKTLIAPVNFPSVFSFRTLVLMESFKDYGYYLKRFIPVDIVVSNTSFISIEYVHPKLSNPLSIKLPKNYFLVGNEILSDIFVCRYLSYEYGRHVIFADMEYKLNIIDSNVNILSIGKDKYIVLTEDGYLVKDIEDLKIY